MERGTFIKTLAPVAIQARIEGSPMFPSVRLAQNILETGCVIHPWNNLGGIKAGSGKPNEWWTGKVVQKGTWEVYDGKRVDISAAFRAYDSVYHFYKDQDLLFGLPRYKRVRSASAPETQAVMLQVCGYATDPEYAKKIISIINSNGLKKYDEEVDKVMMQIEELSKQINQLKEENKQQAAQIKALQASNNLPEPPDWAKEAVAAAVKAKIVDTPNGGSRDFYRIITILHRKGII